MQWKNIKLGRKFFVGFGMVILLLVIVAFGAIYGIRGIVGNAEEVIEGNKLRTDLTEKYVQHLKWANNVNELLTDDEVTSLNVETDAHQCAFGKWYYGEGRKEAERLAPELKPLFDRMEEPHIHLHESAIKISDVFEQSDRKLSAELREMKSDHLIWAHTVKDVLVNRLRTDNIDVQKDPDKCKFGLWMNSQRVRELRNQYPEFDRLLTRIDEPHRELHESVIQVERYYSNNQVIEGNTYFKNRTQKAMNEVVGMIDQMIAWNDRLLEGMDDATTIYHDETMANLNVLGGMFDDVIESSADYIMTDDVMLKEASTTRAGVIIFSIVGVLAAIVFATIIARGIVKPINKGVKFAQEVSEGNLMATVDVYQNDEIGQLSDALRNMVDKLKDIVAEIRRGSDNIAAASMQMSSSSQQMSQGASEQASSAEEVSSSMEEMTANIQQNTENAKETEKIALKAAEGIKQGNESSETSVKSMKEIAEKITIVNDIAFQTNILALNAAVEAARAGEHGKGFAVVAAEVRKLAERSKIAADEIDQLSKSGVKVSEEAGKQLAEIVPEIEKTSKLVQEISAASIEQNSGADQVNSAIQQLNQVTQQNAASSEEMATSAEELSGQADQLKEIIGFFKIDEAHIKSTQSFVKPVQQMKFKNQPQNIKIVEKEKVGENGNSSGVNLNMSEVSVDGDYENY